MINEVQIKKIIPKNGLIGFASVIIDNKLYLGNIAIFTRLNKPNNYRLVFPEKVVANKKIAIFYPLLKEFYFEMEEVITNKLNEKN